MTKEEIRDKALKYISERASGTAEEMNYYAEIITEFVVEKFIVDIKQQAYQFLKELENGLSKM